MQNPEFILPAQEIFHAQSIVSTEETRYYLGGVYIEPLKDGGAIAVASDGHIMLIQRLRTARAARPAILQFIAPRLPPSYLDDEDIDQNDPISWDASLITIDQITPGQTLAAPCHWHRSHDAVRFHIIAHEINGKYPDWRSVAGAFKEDLIPKAPNKPRETMLSPALLAKLAGHFRGIKLHQVGHPNAGAIITFEDAPNAIGIITNRFPPAPAQDVLADMLTTIGRTDLLIDPKE